MGTTIVLIFSGYISDACYTSIKRIKILAAKNQKDIDRIGVSTIFYDEGEIKATIGIDTFVA